MLFLGPLALLISYVKYKDTGLKKDRISSMSMFLPWFIVGFIFTAMIANTTNIPNILLIYSKNISSFFFIIALAAIGLKIELSEIKQVAWQVMIIVIFANISLLAISLIGINYFHLT